MSWSPSVSVTVNEKDARSISSYSYQLLLLHLNSSTVDPASAVPSIVIDGVLTVAGGVVIAGTAGAVSIKRNEYSRDDDADVFGPSDAVAVNEFSPWSQCNSCK